MTAKTHEEKIDELHDMLIEEGCFAPREIISKIVYSVDEWVRLRVNAATLELEQMRARERALDDLVKLSQELGLYDK